MGSVVRVHLLDVDADRGLEVDFAVKADSEDTALEVEADIRLEVDVAVEAGVKDVSDVEIERGHEVNIASETGVENTTLPLALGERPATHQ